MQQLALIFVAFCLFIGPSLAQSLPETRHVLKGRIIRALAFEAGDPNHILVGQKAQKAGSGLVFKSLNGAASWRTQNTNAPLNPAATDVQAVAALSKSVLLAGTWKHGLYRSSDGGRTFQRVKGFPSKDVRDFAINGTTVYAATGQKGVFQSTDGGASWTSIGLAKRFIWSLTTASGRLFASSPQSGVFERVGEKWVHSFDKDEVYATAVSADPRQRLALAAETGLYRLKGKTWHKTLAGEKFAAVLFTPSGHLIAGSWSNGLVVFTPDGRVHKRILAGKAVIHLAAANGRLFAGTWGDGLHSLALKSLLP